MGELQLQQSIQTGKAQQVPSPTAAQWLLHPSQEQFRVSAGQVPKIWRGPVPAAAQVPGENYFPSTFSTLILEGTDNTIPNPDTI